MASDDTTYISGLPRFVDKTLQSWARQKRQNLEQKLIRNFNAVTNRDDNLKKWKKKEAEGWRSDTWIGFVRVKVWAFYSVMLDTVMKAGKIPFTLEPSPYEEYDDPAMIADRDKRIERMTDKIESQLAVRKADREYMRKWLSGAYYGMAFSKFDIDTVSSNVFKRVDVGLGDAAQYMSPEELAQYTRYEMVQDKEDVPGHRYVSVWNMIWDMEAETLQPPDSAGYSEIIHSSPFELRELMGGVGYLDDMIKRVIDRNKDNHDTKEADVAMRPGASEVVDRKKTITRYEFYMRAPRKLVDEFEQLIKSRYGTDSFELGLAYDDEDTENSGDEVEIMGEMADKDIIRFIRNNTGKRPHKMWVVEQNLDESTGTGIADNMEDVQSALVGMIRAFEDNKKLSANVTTAVKARDFNSPGQLNDIVPGKKYDISDSCDDVRKAIMPIVYPDVGESLMSGISLMMQLKDDVSMIPTIMQGFNLPKHQPDTAYEMRQLTENAGKYVGQAIRNNDEMFIEPEIKDIYEYNMLYGDDESCKVSCKVQPNGFTSFQNKEIRGERMRQAIALFTSSEILNPYVKIRPHLDVIYESMDEDPDKFLNSDDEMSASADAKEQMMQQQLQQQEEQFIKQQEMEIEKVVAQEKEKHLGDIEEILLKHENQMDEIKLKHEQEMETKIAEAVGKAKAIMESIPAMMG